jgi:hypothetical protein
LNRVRNITALGETTDDIIFEAILGSGNTEDPLMEACERGAFEDARQEMARLVDASVERLNARELEKQDCFLTTACCELIGLADDCFELRTLRRYRDEVLATSPGGRDDIERYYALAPAILASMRRNKRERELLRLYFTHILPSALLSYLGLNRAARRLYTHMMRVLSRRHLAVLAPIAISK